VTRIVSCVWLLCRNAIVLSPHVRAAKCSIAAARIVREAAERAGAPPGLIQWIDKPSLVLATALMKDPKINLILATGEQEFVLVPCCALATASCML
jgi:acetaldehyde dehydrogenase/alcohol dehydrogenase